MNARSSNDLAAGPHHITKDERKSWPGHGYRSGLARHATTERADPASNRGGARYPGFPLGPPRKRKSGEGAAAPSQPAATPWRARPSERASEISASSPLPAFSDGSLRILGLRTPFVYLRI